jgi:septal ring-binding cell division protein DamX
MLMRFKSSGPWWKVENFDQVVVYPDTLDGVTTWHLRSGALELGSYATEAPAQAALEKILDQVGSEDLT